MGLIRLFLALAVLTHHEPILSRELLPGALSVRLFFIISGFYMALILNERYSTQHKILFYSSRLLRLFPGYLAIAALSLLALLLMDIHPFITREDIEALRWESPGTIIIAGLSNLLILGQNLFFLFDSNPESGLSFTPCADCPTLGFWLLLIPQAWSLAVELGFYLLAPFIVNRHPLLLILLFSCSLTLHLSIVAWVPDGDNIAHHTLLPQLHLFIMGALSFRLVPLARHLPRILGLAGLPLLLTLLCTYQSMTITWKYPLMAMILAVSIPFIFESMRHARWDRLIGELSYPLYISQFLVIAVFDHLLGEPNPLWVLIGVCCLGTTIYILIDLPIARFKSKRLLAQLVIPRSREKQELFVPILVSQGPSEIELTHEQQKM
ncbi:acyltransferase family protein [Desulfovibrio ferrophilus]|uniref:Acyltransferase 3 n=1 Tax=Desulfovibrio ferrophilus TaxID=241368 RepID=A0A2Z6AXW1_9BACT|nr:acyltransferase family protein [Desulfovibrio ferrophilus]BBD08094.1 acyltransferase 3 [Desulfovibrio ferrophilus]